MRLINTSALVKSQASFVRSLMLILISYDKAVKYKSLFSVHKLCYEDMRMIELVQHMLLSLSLLDKQLCKTM